MVVRKGCWIVVASLLLSGCSLLFVKGPPANHATLATVDCSYRNTAPIVDTVLAGLAVLDVALAAGASEEQWEDLNLGQSQSTALLFGLVRLAVYGGSAAYGYYGTSSCRSARQAAQLRQGAPPPGAVLVVPPGSPAPAAPVAPAAPAAPATPPAPPAPTAAPAPVTPPAPHAPTAAPAPVAPRALLLPRTAAVGSLAMRAGAQ